MVESEIISIYICIQSGREKERAGSNIISYLEASMSSNLKQKSSYLNMQLYI